MASDSDTKTGKTIFDAVRSNNVKDLETLVGYGVCVNEVDQRNEDKFTPLHWAAHSGSLECMHWLLWQAANIDAQTPKGWSPAHIASIRGHDACVQALINNNVNLNTRDRRGQTCLHMGCAHGNSFVVHTLLRGGADVSLQDANGWTPVFTAAYHGRLGCLQMLIKWGAKLDEVDNDGNTLAHLIAMEGHLPCLKYLVSVTRDLSGLLGARNDQGETPKSLAEQFYKEDCCTYLDALEWEKDHPEQAENITFPAHVAAFNGDLEHLKLLIEQGIVNINERDERGSTLAHKAAGQGHIEILQWLLEMGASVELTNQAGETVKDVARRFSQLACLKILGGSDKNEIDRNRQKSETSKTTTRRKLTAKEEERQRARMKIDELQKQYELAKKNYQQLGGQLEEDKQRQIQDQAAQKTIDDLQTTLEFERVKREKLEADLDKCREEIGRLINALRAQEDKLVEAGRSRPASAASSSSKMRKAKSTTRRTNRVEKETGFVFRRQKNVEN